MRTQKGCIREERGRWCLRWRETIRGDDGEPKRVMRFKVLDEVSAEHRRNRDRKTGKLRVPPEIESKAAQILEPLNLAAGPSATATATRTIGELFDQYIAKIVEPHRKPSTLKSCKDIWRCHLQHRIEKIRVSDFELSSASNLWEAIHTANPKLAKRTLSHIRFFVSGLFKFAKDRGLYRRENPAGADLPEGLKPGKATFAYKMEDLNAMLTALQEQERTPKNLLAQAILATAFGSGLRKGELMGLTWENFHLQKDGSAKIAVTQSVWNGQIVKPKTETSADDVNLGPDFVAYVEQYRAAIGDVRSGFMFGYSSDRPINLDSFYRWTMVPLLNRCAICKRPALAHGEESVFHPERETEHEYARDESMPTWRGYHAFRRGAATHLAKNFGSTKGVEAAARTLRHSDEKITEAHYIKESKQMRRARVAAKELEQEELKHQAAGVLTDGLRTARKQARPN